MATTPIDPEVPSGLPARFAVQGKLGQGGMASVYLAFDDVTGTQVAIKILHPHLRSDEMVVQRFRREIAAARRIAHENVIAIFDLLTTDDAVALVLEYHAGADLKRIVRRNGPLPNDQVLSVARQVLAGLGAAHAHGVVHRDLKPQNILVDDGGRVKLTDFGLARVDDMVGLTTHTMTLGTPEYMAPELLLSPLADGRADIYSLGVTLFECATGKLPYRAASPAALLRLHESEPVPDPRTLAPALDEKLGAAIRRALAKEPEDRFQTAAEMARALQGESAAVPGRDLVAREAFGERCKKCDAPMVPRMSVCLDCGNEPIRIGGEKGNRLLEIRPTKRWGWGWRKSWTDPLTFEQKHELIEILKDMGGAIVLDTKRLDQRLRRLPVTVAQELSAEDAARIQVELLRAGVETRVGHHGILGHARRVLLSGDGFLIGAFAVAISATAIGMALGRAPWMGTPIWLGAIAVPAAVRLLQRRKPIAVFWGTDGNRKGTHPLGVRARAVFLKLGSGRIRSILRRILGRGMDIRGDLEASPAVPGETLADLDTLLQSALHAGESIAALQKEAATLDARDLYEQIKAMDERIAAAATVDETETFIGKKRRAAQSLERLEEVERQIVGRTGDLISVASRLNEAAANVASLQTTGGDSQESRAELSLLVRDLNLQIGAAGELEPRPGARGESHRTGE